MSEMDEKVLDEAMESSTEENASETKEDENVTSTEETAETAENADAEASEADSEDPDKKKSFFKKLCVFLLKRLTKVSVYIILRV